MRRTFTHRGAAGVLSLAAALGLAGCGSSPPANITLAAPAATSSTPEKVGDLATERIKWASNKPDCKGDCPRIEIDSVAFPGIPKLTALVDHVLAYMTGTDAQRRGPYETLSEYTQYFWQTARPRDATTSGARHGRRRRRHRAAHRAVPDGFGPRHSRHPVPELGAGERPRDGAGRGADSRPPRRIRAALRRAHAKWLQGNAEARRDPAAYDKMWPFQENDNYALTRDGMVIKYPAYSIAPYAQGEPEISIPYSELRGILKPELLPAS